MAGPVADLVTRKRVHPAYAWGLAAIVLSNVLVAPLAFSPSVKVTAPPFSTRPAPASPFHRFGRGDQGPAKHTPRR